jgi:hypothetical protein
MKKSLLQDIHAANIGKTGRSCTVGLVINTIGDEADELKAALKDPTIPSTVIAKVLTGRGFRVSGDVMARHRRGECRCES